MSKMTTYTEGFEPYTITDEQAIYKWLASVYIHKHQGSKDIRQIRYHQKYDGKFYATYYISNGTRVEIEIDERV